MGDPSMQGMPAASDAQGGSKSFPADSDPGDVVMVSGLPGDPQVVGSPVQPEMRQDTPVADMGAGYREADPDTDPS